MDDVENVLEMTFQELVELINSIKGEFIIRVIPREECSDEKESV